MHIELLVVLIIVRDDIQVFCNFYKPVFYLFAQLAFVRVYVSARSDAKTVFLPQQYYPADFLLGNFAGYYFKRRGIGRAVATGVGACRFYLSNLWRQPAAIPAQFGIRA